MTMESPLVHGDRGHSACPASQALDGTHIWASRSELIYLNIVLEISADR